MKRLGLFFCLATFAHATIASTAQWELRTTGSDNNGGFFVAGGGGTDFSQQNAAQYTFADLASANGTTNPCVVTSASHSFVAADAGNGMHISAGTNWTTGWYQIVSVAANAATLDRACGSVAALSGGTYFVGGGLLTPGGVGTALGSGCGSGGAATVCGTINNQAGTYTVTASITISASVFWQCYNVTHGDNAGVCTITTATNSTDLFHLAGAGGQGGVWAFDNMTLSNTAGVSARGIAPTAANSYYLGVRNSSFNGFTNAIDSSNVTFFLFFVIELNGVEVKNSTGAGVDSVSTIICEGCWIHNNTGVGFLARAGNTSGQPLVLVNSIVSNNGSVGADPRGVFICINSDLANNTGSGAGNAAGNGQYSLTDCPVFGNGGFGVNALPAQGNLLPLNISRVNAYGSNTSGNRNNFNAGLSDITLTANPFVSATNFALNATAGGGAALKNAGFPGAFPGGTTTGSISVGAVQPVSSAACTGFCKMR